jgi:hypothetical protein
MGLEKRSKVARNIQYLGDPGKRSSDGRACKMLRILYLMVGQPVALTPGKQTELAVLPR